ncbi:urocortin [Zonotrichia leucophrys gambelii]|uniref:urocortin n=1 Tax=Zonotrichia leucophrys gambelii TaxID=257770 RepID=UPI00313FEB70
MVIPPSSLQPWPPHLHCCSPTQLDRAIPMLQHPLGSASVAFRRLPLIVQGALCQQRERCEHGRSHVERATCPQGSGHSTGLLRGLGHRRWVSARLRSAGTMPGTRGAVGTMRGNPRGCGQGGAGAPTEHPASSAALPAPVPPSYDSQDLAGAAAALGASAAPAPRSDLGTGGPARTPSRDRVGGPAVTAPSRSCRCSGRPRFRPGIPPPSRPRCRPCSARPFRPGTRGLHAEKPRLSPVQLTGGSPAPVPQRVPAVQHRGQRRRTRLEMRQSRERSRTGAAAPATEESGLCRSPPSPSPSRRRGPAPRRSGAPRSPAPAARCVPGADVSPGARAHITPGRAAGSAPAGPIALSAPPAPAPAPAGTGHSAPGAEGPRMRRALLTLLLLLARPPPAAARPASTDGSVPAAGTGDQDPPLWPPLAPPPPGPWRGRRDEPPLSIDLTFHLLRHLLLLARAQSQRARADSNRRILDAVGR